MEVIATDVGDMATQVLPVYIKTNVVIIVRRWGISAQCVVKRRVRQPRQLPPRKDKKSSKQRKTHLVDVQVDSDSFSDEAFDTSHNHVHHSGCHGRMKKLTTKLLLNGTEIRMEIDTGAELSTIPFSVVSSVAKIKLNMAYVVLQT